MLDRFKSHSRSLEGPATHAFAIIPDDVEILEEVCRALYVGMAGNVSVTLVSGAEITFTNVPGGTILPVRALSVLATGTTAQAIVGLA